MNDFFNLAERGLTESLAVIGENFQWRALTIPCAINHQQHHLTAAKSSFPNNVYPKRGDIIMVQGKRRQVTRLNNAALRAAAGGLLEDIPFTDDPSDPSIEIEYDKLIKK